ncbi:MAG TPA: hypothetical protein VEC57_07805 [Candidatus Limnocylindrales bacterium]|nr:hypothetical protein [Candidatus Limnocylindrales bacterium]
MKNFLAASTAALALTLCAGGAALAAKGDCGQPQSTGEKPNTSDALFTLRAGVGALTCDPWVCDVDSNGKINAGDALRILKFAVGQAGITLSCPPQTTTTTTTSSSTTTLPPALTWTQIQSIFEQSCAGPVCHTQGGNQGGMSDLDDYDDGYEETVNADSECVVCKAANECSGDYTGPGCVPTAYEKRVIPGDPDASFLIRKLEGTGDCKADVGSCTMPMLSVPLSQEVIDGIRAWIAGGAPKN